MSEKEKVNILMVDDQPSKLLSYEVILAELGENLVKMSSARDALEYLLKTDVAVVLLDVSMPDIDGFEMAEMIRSHPRFQRTAIIFISAIHLTDLDRLKGYQRGAVDYISVPVNPELLRAKVSLFAELNRKTRQLERLNHELESRVLERTHELRESENQFRTLANSIPQLAWMAHPDGSIFWFNDRWYEYTGTSPQQMKDHGWTSLLDLRNTAGLFERWDDFIRAGAPFEMEFSLRGADGVPRWFLTQVTPVTDAAGNVDRWFGTYTNIHEQRELRRALEETQERLVMAQKAARCGSFDWDLTLDLSHWSDELAEMYGFAPGQFSGTRQAWLDCVFPEDRDMVKAAVVRAFDTEVFEIDFRIRLHRSADLRWMSTRGRLRRDAEGTPVRLVGLTVDVTRIKQAEEALKKAHDELETRVQVRTAELKIAEESLRRLSGRLMLTQDDERRRIARELHDGLGQYLIAVKMSMAMLSMGLTQDGKLNGYLEDANSQIDHAIAETRTMSYLLHPPLLDETGLESAISWYAEGFAKRSGIAVNVEISPGLGRLESEAETAIFRVVQECLTNIHRHSGSPTADIRLIRDAGEVRLQVRDQGKGMPHQIETDSGSTVGIGVQGMRERVRQLKGNVEIISGNGSGTRVIVTIPDTNRGKTALGAPSRDMKMFQTEAP